MRPGRRDRCPGPPRDLGKPPGPAPGVVRLTVDVGARIAAALAAGAKEHAKPLDDYLSWVLAAHVGTLLKGRDLPFYDREAC